MPPQPSAEAFYKLMRLNVGVWLAVAAALWLMPIATGESSSASAQIWETATLAPSATPTATPTPTPTPSATVTPTDVQASPGALNTSACSTDQLTAAGTVGGQSVHVVVRVRNGESCQGEVSGVIYDMPNASTWPQQRRALSTGHVSPGNPFVADLPLGPCRWQWDAITGADAPETLTGPFFGPNGTLIGSGRGGQPCPPTGTPTATPTSTPTPSPTATPTSSPTPTAAPGCVGPPPGLVSWWPGDGNALDLIGGNDGARRNGAGFAPGLVGEAIHLDGIDDFVEVPDSPSLTLSSLTLDAWVWPDVVTGTLHSIVTKYNASLAGPEGVSWSLLGTTNGGLALTVYQSPTQYRSLEIDSQVLAAGQWQHVAATFDGPTQEIRIYLNGVERLGRLDPGSSTVVINDSLASVNIGALINAQGNPHGLWAGSIDEVDIFNRALTASEIQAIHQAGSGGKCASEVPVNRLRFFLPLIWRGP
jgi:hypothetical protein